MPDSLDRDLVDLRDRELFVEFEQRQEFGTVWPLADLTAESKPGPVVLSEITALLAGDSLSSITNLFHVPWNDVVRPARTRVGRLRVGDRELNDTNGTMRITAASGEERMIGDALISTTPWNPASTSLDVICRAVLARYGAVLSPGGADATVAQVSATIWQPGVGAWQYLNPMLEAASLRLWCDELGVWRLTARASATSGSLTITPTRDLTGLVDRMTLDPDTWFDAVVVEYSWTDEAGVGQKQWDVYPEGVVPRAARRVERQTVYPGPGAARGLFRRGRGRGRILDVQALSNYATTPGMGVTITPPDTDAQTGYVSAVTWRYPDDEMDVATRDLVDTPSTAWAFVLAGIKWSDAPVGMSWLEYTPEGL